MYSWSPLLVAVIKNFPDVVKTLLKHSPNVNRYLGHIRFMMVVMMESEIMIMVRLLMIYLYSVGQEGLTPLALACKEGNTDIVYQLVAAGAYVNLQVSHTLSCRY